MTLIEMLAGVGYLILDICAFCSVLGSALILIATLTGRTKKQIPEQVWMWSGGGLTLGAIFFSSLLWTNDYPTKTFIFGLSYPLVGILLLLSFGLLLASTLVRRRHVAAS